MNLFRTTAAILALTTGLLALPAQAGYEQQNGENGGSLNSAEAPDGFAMIADLFIARPLLIGATAIGAVAFVVALPFAATGGGIGAAGRALVVEPGKAAFVRCLGCTGDGWGKRE
jgi:hypothetical protein